MRGKVNHMKLLSARLTQQMLGMSGGSASLREFSELEQQPGSSLGLSLKEPIAAWSWGQERGLSGAGARSTGPCYEGINVNSELWSTTSFL